MLDDKRCLWPAAVLGGEEVRWQHNTMSTLATEVLQSRYSRIIIRWTFQSAVDELNADV